MALKVMAPGVALVQNEGDGPLLSDVQSALDLLASAWHEGDVTRLIILKEDVAEAFFDLSTRIAGEALQKFVNYNFRVAIVGDFSAYTSKSLRDFIYESNKGGVILFVDSVERAVADLS